MTPPTLITGIAMTEAERLKVFTMRKLRGGAATMIEKCRSRINPRTGTGEMLPQYLEEARAMLTGFTTTEGTYQDVLRALIAAGDRAKAAQA